MSPNLTFHELTDINDDLLLPWLDLYEMSFPPEEKVLVSVPLNILKLKAQGQKKNHHLLAVLDDSEKLVGIAWYQMLPDVPAGYLWYLAVSPELRNQKIGSQIYREVVRRIEAEGVKAMLFEVEIPEHCRFDKDKMFAERRIDFYKRMGASMVKGIDYIQQVAPHQPAIPMHIMIHPFKPLTPDEVFDLVKAAFEECVTKVGEVSLEPFA